MKEVDFSKKIENRSVIIGIVGIGYVGLPLALAFAERGFKTLGFDIDPKKIEAVNSGRSYISYILEGRINRVSDHLSATQDFTQVSTCDAILLCLPTPLSKNREPDLSYIKGTAESIAPYIRSGQLISLESTTYPGTTEEVLIPILESGSGLSAREDFFVSFSPEREDPQNPDFNFTNIPKVVGGADERSLAVASALYSAVAARVIKVGSPATAEAAKLLENIFRSVNIALVNEMKMVFDRMGLDVWEVIEVAATKPFGFMPFYPGPGLGGHCVPIDPFYLTWKAREVGISTRFIELAGEINSGMPDYVVERLMYALNEHGKAIQGCRILILGMAYKKNVEDLRESASLRLLSLLSHLGATVEYHDQHVLSIMPTREYSQFAGLASVPIEHIADYDATIIATAHDCVDYDFVAKKAKLILDTRNAIKDRSLRHVYRA
ncbi:MAG TPA: nucleotide sugar dehydrogenase [bacterium]|nr:nucleotide sugar dehydrogenase [bacterium]